MTRLREAYGVGGGGLVTVDLVYSLIFDPGRLFSRAWSRLALLAISLKPGVRVGRRVRFNGVPLVDIRDGASLVIEDNVTLNSRNAGYHLNMHSPVKILADRTGAAIRIGENTRIHGSCIHAYESVVVGRNCLIAANCQIFDGNGHDLSFPNVSDRIHTSGRSRPVTIEDDVWIGANCVILPGASIGRGAVIGANSVVTGRIPPMVVAAGNPARVVKDFSHLRDG